MQSSIADFVDLEHLQRIQDSCSAATGIALVTVDYRGVPVTRYSGFSEHCLIGRSNPKFKLLCERCDAQGGIRSTLMGEACIYKCHAGLVDLAVPIIVKGAYVGAVLGGQVRLADEPADLETIISPRDSLVDDQQLAEQLARAWGKTVTVSYDRLWATVQTLRSLVTYAVGTDLSTSESDASLIQEKNEQLNAEREAREELEVALRKRDYDASRRDEVCRHANYALNAIHCLACKEGAARTDAATLDFADIIHYLIDTSTPIVTLGDELVHMEALLRVYQAWRGDTLQYSVKVPERYRTASCPFMTLDPIVMAIIGAVMGSPEEACSIDLVAEEDGDWVVVQIAERGLSVSDVSDAFEEESASRFSLEFADRNLSRLTRGASSITARSHPSDPNGAIISFRLPYLGVS